MPLSKQEKLALALTSAGSQRNLAALVGVSPRTIGRWLREGESKGVREIPDAPEINAAINTAFEIHRDLSAEQAMVDGLPFNRYRPVYKERKTLRTGVKGDRVVAEHTQFIRSELRQKVMADQQKTRRYISASVRSIINLQRYFEGRAAEELETGRRRGISKKELARAMLKSFQRKEKTEKGRIIDKTEPFPLFTRYASISPLRAADDTRGIQDIEDQLRQKHEPATGEAGTVAADQFLFQVAPEGYGKQSKQRPDKRASTRARKK